MKALSLLMITVLLSIHCYGQQPVITDSATTSSICFNDGSITVNASGGTGSYTFSIIAGPSYPNITYPINLPASVTVFQTLPRGQYTIRVTDAAGHTAFATATVGGTYTFPVISPPPPDTVYSSCITVSTVGGNPPYTYARSSIGTNTGFGPYQTSNTFCHLCNGPNWIRVMDACSNIYTTNKIIVEVPVPQYVVTSYSAARVDHITVAVTVAGAPPYTYHLASGAVSVTNTTGVFSIPAQCGVENITVTDSCGRVYQQSVSLHQLSVSNTSSCRTGSAVLSIDSSAIGPYTITGSNGTLTTRQRTSSFNNLPIDSPYHFTVRDSCGNVVQLNLPCDSTRPDSTFFYNVCPFDSSLHLSSPVTLCFPAVVTCLSCTPVQIDTIYTNPARLFTGIQVGVQYRVRIQDQCGFDYTTTDQPGYEPLSIIDSVLTCSDFVVTSAPQVLVPPIHYTVFDNSTYIDSIVGNRAVFYHLPMGNYQVTATQRLCLPRTITVALPALGGACSVPMLDSACTHAYAVYQSLTNYTETYSLVNTMTAAAYIQRIPTPYPGAVLFYDVPVGHYNLVSDSGCSTPFVLPPFTPDTITAISTHQCTGRALIVATISHAIRSCNTSQQAYYVLLKDNQHVESNLTGRFSVSDTGNYVIRLFYSNTTIFGFAVPYDTICPIDTTIVYVTNGALPNIVSTLSEVCGHTMGSIPYTIFGGTPPYTVQLLGYPFTQTVNGQTDTFPNVYPGIYTMVVQDFCGISRSFSVSVVDTCSPDCITQSHFSISDSVACIHSTVSLHNESIAATHYRWNINGAIYAYITDTTFTATAPGTYTITLYAYIGICTDSVAHRITVQDTLHDMGRRDTSLCPPISLHLNTHVANTIWSDGTHDSVTIATMPGLYTAMVSNSCGSASDSVNIIAYPGISGFDVEGAKTDLCEGERDSIIFSAYVDSTGQPAVVFRWNTGAYDSAAYSSGITVYQAGTYQVTVDNGFCPLVKVLTVDTVSCDSECIAGIAVPTIFSPNGDGRNDTFYILHLCDIKPFTMHIYNRWGELVFESKDIHLGWDGTFKGMPEPEEVYWLWLEMTLPDGRTFYRQGTVTLVR